MKQILRVISHSTALDIDCQLETENPEYFTGSPRPPQFHEFEDDGWRMDIEEFKKKWNIITLDKLGKSHCSGYTDRLNPDNSFMTVSERWTRLTQLYPELLSDDWKK